MPTVGVYISPDESPELLDAAENAVDLYNDALGVDLLDLRVDETTALAYGDLGSIIIVGTDKVLGPVDRRAFTVSTGLVGHIAVERDTMADPDFTEAMRFRLVAHEMGHALGLKHESTESNLMYDPEWFGDGGSDLTKKQVRRIRALTGLRSAF